jgi:diguanylate cyclase (GGDEF)-like protein
MGSILVGLGISGMHYTGVMGLNVPEHVIHYNMFWVITSIITMIIATLVSFGLGNQYHHQNEKKQYGILLLVAVIFALGIVSMHYMGLTAIEFWHMADRKHLPIVQSNPIFIFSLIVTISLVLAIIFFVSSLERRLKEKEHALSSLNQQLKKVAQQDHLTKLPNRFFLNEHIPKILAADNRIAFLHIDLDVFKVINDAYGHQVGDQLLQQVGARINQVIFKNMTFIHLGGDEFLLITAEVRTERLKFIASRILREIHHSYFINGEEIKISASMGIAIYLEHGKNLQELLINADIAMYAAKASGGNSYSFFDASIDTQKIKERLQLLNELNRAIAEEQFILLYQPKYTAQVQLCGVEALIRWQHPKLGIVEPNYFIQMIENTGLIIDIGYWVIEQACKQIQQWEQEEKFCYLPLSINLSALQFEHANLLAQLGSSLNKYQIAPQHLMIEVTETTAMRKVDETVQTFQALSALGVLIAIDDFGTGYSSFAYLKDFPVDELKIDSGFILNVESNSKQEIILASIIDLATKLGLIVTAEGVENAQQVAVLTRLGCHQIQGFYFSKPVAVTELPAVPATQSPD